MSKERDKINRRNFLKTMGAAGLAPALAGMTNASAPGAKVVGPNEPNAEEKAQKKGREYSFFAHAILLEWSVLGCNLINACKLCSMQWHVVDWSRSARKNAPRACKREHAD